MEQFEVIDVKTEDSIRKTWKGFIHSHHYDYETSYFDSSLALNPLRTCESYFQHIEAMSVIIFTAQPLSRALFSCQWFCCSQVNKPVCQARTRIPEGI
jgi:hypothetical protein